MADYVPVLLTVAVCLFARPIGERLGVVDLPDSLRKTHPEPTPLVGGIAIMMALVVWATIRLAWRDAPSDGLEPVIILCGGGVAVLGFMDDQRMISPAGRLILLAIFSVVAIRLDHQLFVSRLNTDAWGPVTLWPTLSISLTVLALMGFSSAVNMVDGVNGLVLSLTCIWSLCLGFRGTVGAEAADLLAAAAFVTLLFNARGRLFLGDCGAFAIAFTLGILAIATHNEGSLPLETVVVCFLIPVVDCLRLIPMRVLEGRSPFRPDRLHFHHRLGARLGERTAILSYVGLVGVTSVVATLRPDFSVFCICIDAVFYGGFLLADVVVPLAPVTRPAREEKTNVVAIPAKQRRGG